MQDNPRKRISKPTDERRAEIVEVARRLFANKGFTATRIAEIVREIGVSQGVFYYYFPSKEAVIDAIVEGYIAPLEAAAREVVDAPHRTPLGKLEALADLQMRQNHAENARVHAIKGVDIHQRLLHALVTRFVPLMHEAWSDDPADRYAFEATLVAGTMLFDPGLFAWPPDERDARIEALIARLERSLGQPPGALAFYRRVMGHSRDEG